MAALPCFINARKVRFVRDRRSRRAREQGRRSNAVRDFRITIDRESYYVLGSYYVLALWEGRYFPALSWDEREGRDFQNYNRSRRAGNVNEGGRALDPDEFAERAVPRCRLRKRFF